MWAGETGLALSLGGTLLSSVYPVLLTLGMDAGREFSFAASCKQSLKMVVA